MNQPIRILTTDFEWLGEIDDYESLQFTRRSQKAGEFELHINVNKNLTETLQKDNLIYLSSRKVGIISYRQLSQDGKDTLTIRGTTLHGLMSRRVTIPPVGQGYDRIKDNAETVLKHYVLNNVINPVDVSRIIPNLEVAPDQKRGIVVDYQSRLKQLDTELGDISNVSEIGWEITLDLERQKFIFDVFESRDLTTEQSTLPPVIFSVDFDNIQSHTFTDSSVGYKNAAYVGGQGEEEERRIITIGTTSGFERYETFVDARDVAETESVETEEGFTDVPIPESEINAQLIDRGNKELKDLDKIVSFESEILTYGPFVYEQDWDLWDIVTVQDKKLGLTLNTHIPEIKEIYEVGGFRLEATFGNTIPTLIEKIKKTIDAPMVEKSTNAGSTPTNISQLVNDAGYITVDDIPQVAPFVFDQLSPSVLWTITHNLNKYPNVTITDSAGSVVLGDVKHTSLNTTEISFSSAFSGKATLF